MSLDFEYMLDLATGEPPAANNVRFNNASPSLVTKIWVHDKSSLGKDNANIFKLMKTYDTLYFQEKDDATKWQSFLPTGPIVDKGVYTEFPVAWQAGGGLMPAQRILFLMYYDGGAGPVTEPDKGDFVTPDFLELTRRDPVAGLSKVSLVRVSSINQVRCLSDGGAELRFNNGEFVRPVENYAFFLDKLTDTHASTQPADVVD